MEGENIDLLKRDLYRYRTLYEIGLEENKLLKEQVIRVNEDLEAKVQELNNKNQEEPKRSILYRGLRKIYRTIVKR